jgi:hypothetical protein
MSRGSAERLLRKVICEDGGPLTYNASEEEQRSFDLPTGSPEEVKVYFF